MQKSNSFSRDKSIEIYNEYKSVAQSSNMDCSEITEDLIRLIGGRALLILSNGYKSYKMFDILKSNGEKLEFIYHYALVTDNNEVIDPMLDYYKVGLSDYLRDTGISKNDEVTVEIINSTSLPVYV